MRAPAASGAALFSLLLLGGCAGSRAPRKDPPAASEASPEERAASAPRAAEGCRPLMTPLVEAFDPDRWGRFGDEGWDPGEKKRHSCWNRVWEVPTAVVVYPAAVIILIGLVTSPVWLPLLLIL